MFLGTEKINIWFLGRESKRKDKYSLLATQSIIYFSYDLN